MRFPTNEEFKKGFTTLNLYNTKFCKFCLAKLENYNRKEKIDIEEYTIEHILPQNPDLSVEWKNMLGEGWQELQESYLHTIGNLTLTGHNSELSDYDFQKKQSMKGGFSKSPLKLNQSLKSIAIWNRENIIDRANSLLEEALLIWPYVKPSETDLKKYHPNKYGSTYNISKHPSIHNGEMQELFAAFRKKIVNLDTGVSEEILKVYVAYKICNKNFLEILPQKANLKMQLVIDFEKIEDPKKKCLDAENIKGWGTGNVQVNFSHIKELEYVFSLAKQAFEENYK